MDHRRESRTVVRGGFGFLYSPHLFATVRQITGDPNAAFPDASGIERKSRREISQWPIYNDNLRDVVIAENAGRKSIFSVIDPEIDAPYTIQSMMERAAGHRPDDVD